MTVDCVICPKALVNSGKFVQRDFVVLGLGPVLPLKGSRKTTTITTTTFKDILDSSVLPLLWNEFGKEPRMSVKVTGPQYVLCRC